MSADGKSEVMYGSHSSGGHSSCPAGVPVEFALLSILAAFGVAFGVLYQALTIITGRRRKRNAEGLLEEEEDANIEPEPEVGFVFRFADFLWLGEFYWLSHNILDGLPQRKFLSFTIFTNMQFGTKSERKGSTKGDTAQLKTLSKATQCQMPLG